MRKRKKLLLAVMAAFMLSPIGQTGTANAADNPNDDQINDRDPKPPAVVDSEWIDIKRKAYNNNHGDGIIMKDRPVRPTSFYHGRQLADSPPLGATGWSIEGNVCERKITHYDPIYQNGVLIEMRPRYQSTWHKGRDWGYPGVYQYNTFNQRDEGPLYQYIDQLNQKYRHLGITNWEGVRGTLHGAGYWNILTFERYEPASEPGACQTGDKHYFYSDNDIVMEGRVQVNKKDPTESKPSPGRNDGDVRGTAYWELVRHDQNANSGVDAYLSLEVAGDHFATRNAKQTLEVGGQSKSGKSELKIRVPDGLTVKNQNMKYSFTYEYTNHYKDIYKCTDSQDGFCYQWTFDKRIPDWDKVKTFNYSNSSKIDHRMKETITGAKIEELFKNYKVGNKDTIASKSQKDSKAYYEDFSKAAGNTNQSEYNLKTQTPIPITPGELAYGVSVPSDSHTKGGYQVLRKEGTNGHFYPADVDDSLKSAYSNNTSVSGYDYAIPYQQSTLTDKGSSGGKRILNWKYVSDLFYMTKHTGYQQGYPYARDMKANYTNGTTLPSNATLAGQMSNQLRASYIAETGQMYVDEMLPAISQADFEKLQRYVIPVAASSILKPNTTYKNHNSLRNLGLNDLTFRFDQSFKFERYLFGAIQDDAWIIEQIDPMTSLENVDPSQIHHMTITVDDVSEIVKYSEQRTKLRMHEFRISDRDFIQNIKNRVGY